MNDLLLLQASRAAGAAREPERGPRYGTQHAVAHPAAGLPHYLQTACHARNDNILSYLLPNWQTQPLPTPGKIAVPSPHHEDHNIYRVCAHACAHNSVLSAIMGLREVTPANRPILSRLNGNLMPIRLCAMQSCSHATRMAGNAAVKAFMR